MGLSGFQRARRLAAEKASVPAETLSYDEAIAILAQPLLTTETEQLPVVPAVEPAANATATRKATKPKTKPTE